MKAALVLCPHWDQRYPTYSGALLAAILRDAGHELAFFDLNQDFLSHASAAGDPIASLEPLWHSARFALERPWERFAPFFDEAARRVANCGARVVGFSVYGSNAGVCLAMARRLKELDPGLFLVFGGPSCFDPGDCRGFLEETAVDAVILGEGDRSFPALLEAFQARRPASAVPGVLTRQNPGAPAPADPTGLETLPTPDFSIYDLTRYPHGELTLETSRGCVRRCDFCSDWRNWKRFRQKSAGRIVSQIFELKAAHPASRGFFFSDSIVNGDVRQLERLADALIAHGSRAPWSGYAVVRPEMTAPFIEKLARSGAWNLFFGIETGSDRLSAAMGKPVARSLNAQVLARTRAAGMTNVVFIMVGHPAEREADFEATLEFIRENASNIGCLSVSMCEPRFMEPEVRVRYGVSYQAGYWATPDGTSTFPVRMERFRRVLETAYDHGVEAHLFRKKDQRSHEFFRESLLSDYFLASRSLLDAAEHLYRTRRLEPCWTSTAPRLAAGTGIRSRPS